MPSPDVDRETDERNRKRLERMNEIKAPDAKREKNDPPSVSLEFTGPLIPVQL